MAENIAEAAESPFSHEGVDVSLGGRVNSNPSGSKTALDKFNIATPGPRDIGSRVPKDVSVRMKKNLAMAAVRKAEKKSVVTADIHHSGGGETSGEEDEEPDLPESDSSDGETLWHLSEDARKGTSAIRSTTGLMDIVV